MRPPPADLPPPFQAALLPSSAPVYTAAPVL